MSRNFIIYAILIFLSACASKPTLDSAMGKCSENVEVIKAYGDTLRLKYDVENIADAKRIADEWCSDRGKISKKNTSNCNGCCVSTYLCFTE
jgi:hypothetical protein